LNLAEYRRMFEAEERQWWYVGMQRITDGLLRPWLRRDDGSRPRLIDAGCGTGANLLHFSDAAWTVGVDLSTEAVALCVSRGTEVVRGSVLQLPFVSGGFDCVTSFDVLYHSWVEDDNAAIAELVRVLAPGGVLFVRLPALRLLYGAHDVEVQTRHRYTSMELRRLLEGAGLDVLALTYCNSLLFPVLLLRRSWDRWTGREGSDVGFLPSPLEALFRGLLTLEGLLLRWGLRFPVGASVVALARKARNRR
jgi:SAM-dependent methyltransferase